MIASRRIACSVHGHIVRIKCAVPSLHASLEHLLAPFWVSDWPDGFVPIDGSLLPYDATEVMDHLPATARRHTTADQSLELYVDGSRFWLVDDRWGMAEIDFEAETWRSWILPAPTITPLEIAELAMLWPAAQLLRGKGLYLVPAIAVTYQDWGLLMLSGCGMEPELTAMARHGYNVIGQRWTALREEDGAIAMLHVPGQLERGFNRRVGPRMIGPEIGTGASLTDTTSWIDLVAESPSVSRHHGFCQAVVLIEPNRRPAGWVRPIAPMQMLEALSSHWPMVELQPKNRFEGRIVHRIAELCPIFEMRLSREPADALEQIESIRATGQPTISERRALWDATPPLNLTPWSLAG